MSRKYVSCVFSIQYKKVFWPAMEIDINILGNHKSQWTCFELLRYLDGKISRDTHRNSHLSEKRKWKIGHMILYVCLFWGSKHYFRHTSYNYLHYIFFNSVIMVTNAQAWKVSEKLSIITFVFRFMLYFGPYWWPTLSFSVLVE